MKVSLSLVVSLIALGMSTLSVHRSHGTINPVEIYHHYKVEKGVLSDFEILSNVLWSFKDHFTDVDGSCSSALQEFSSDYKRSGVYFSSLDVSCSESDFVAQMTYVIKSDEAALLKDRFPFSEVDGDLVRVLILKSASEPTLGKGSFDGDEEKPGDNG